MISCAFSLQATAADTPIKMHILVTDRGPIHANDVSSLYVFIKNTNSPSRADYIPGPLSERVRNRLPNAYVVTSIDLDYVVDGKLAWSESYNPEVPTPIWASGRWPMTVTCPETGPPCNIVSDPAVLPGEEIVMFYFWFSPGEPYGRTVFTFTAHGTLNGEPLDITASSSTIVTLP